MSPGPSGIFAQRKPLKTVWIGPLAGFHRAPRGDAVQTLSMEGNAEETVPAKIVSTMERFAHDELLPTPVPLLRPIGQ